MSKNQKVVFELNPREEDESASKLNAIKNLIFGDTIQLYDAEFEQLKEDILAKKKVLEQLIDEVQTEINQSIDTISTDINIRISDLEHSLEGKMENLQAESVNKKILGKLLMDLGEKISKK